MNVASIVDRIDNFRMKNHSNESGTVKSRTDGSRGDTAEPKKADIENTLVKLNKSLEDINEKISFTYHEVNKRVIIKVINSETREVVREIPAKDIVKLSEHLQEFIGMLVDESR